MKSELPLVYSCSGASSAAQMANHIAVRLDRLRVAEMSCIAGVGGEVKPLVRTAKSGRPLVVLDGCPLQCAAQILKRHGLEPDQHFDLSKMGVKKKQHEDFEPREAAEVLEQILEESGLAGPPPGKPGVSSPASPPKENAAASQPDTSPTPDEVFSSPVCYTREFTDW